MMKRYEKPFLAINRFSSQEAMAADLYSYVGTETDESTGAVITTYQVNSFTAAS